MNPNIIFEDENLLVVGKPSGWITNEASTTKDQPVLQTWVSKNFKFSTAKSKEFRSGIVHRLDKETSGILILAKDKESFEALQKQFKDRSIKKEYLALVHGKLEPEKGRVDVPVGRLSWNRERFGVLPGGRTAQTDYVVEKHFQKGNEKYSLVRLNPETGRTHQIRIHLKHLGYPIVADIFYAGRKRARDDRLWCPRMFLHAQGIKFSHPQSNKNLEFTAKLPPDLQKALDSLEMVS